MRIFVKKRYLLKSTRRLLSRNFEKLCHHWISSLKIVKMCSTLQQIFSIIFICKIIFLISNDTLRFNFRIKICDVKNFFVCCCFTWEHIKSNMSYSYKKKRERNHSFDMSDGAFSALRYFKIFMYVEGKLKGNKKNNKI